MGRVAQLVRTGAAFSYVVAGLGGIVAIISARLGLGSLVELGPGFFPFIVGVILVLAGVLSGNSTVRRLGNKSYGKGPLVAGNVKGFVLMILLFVGWLLLMPFLGYVLATMAATIGIAKIQGLKGWVRPFILSLAIILFVYFLFNVLLYADLPRGVL